MDGAIVAGRYVAAQVQGQAPPVPAQPASEAVPVCAPCMTPDELSPAQVKQALAQLCEDLYAGCAMSIPAWEGPPEPWRHDPAALQAWQESVEKSLAGGDYARAADGSAPVLPPARKGGKKPRAVQ